MQTSSLVWTRPRGPRLVYTIYYNRIYRVRKACTIHKKMCDEQIRQYLFWLHRMNKQGYIQNGSICFLLNRFSIEKKKYTSLHLLILRELELSDDEDRDLQG